jgi:hypothetical protein
MIGGNLCTRACGFCDVKTGRPDALDSDEPARVAGAVARLGLRFAVVTAVARDDLADGGAAHFARTVEAIRARAPGCRIEVLIPDLKGSVEALRVVLGASPDVLNHNLETVERLQKPVRKAGCYSARPRSRPPRVPPDIPTQDGAPGTRQTDEIRGRWSTSTRGVRLLTIASLAPSRSTCPRRVGDARGVRRLGRGGAAHRLRRGVLRPAGALLVPGREAGAARLTPA